MKLVHPSVVTEPREDFARSTSSRSTSSDSPSKRVDEKQYDHLEHQETHTTAVIQCTVAKRKASFQSEVYENEDDHAGVKARTLFLDDPAEPEIKE